MMKLNKITLKGFRGVREELSLDFQGDSVLIFGENGSGKSSITDAVEWFYFDQVKHLSAEEIDRRGGITALRNSFLENADISSMKVVTSEGHFDSVKTIAIKKNVPEKSNSNTSEEFAQYLEDTQKERLFLRYEDLTEFVLAPKGQRLQNLASIIGYEVLLKAKSALSKGVNDIKKIIKAKNFETQISIQDGIIIKHLSGQVVSDGQYIEKINELIGSLKLSRSITMLCEVDQILELLKQSDNFKIVEQNTFYNELLNSLLSFNGKRKILLEEYKNYYDRYQKVIEDIDALKKMALDKLLSEGLCFLKSESWDNDLCPLCLNKKEKKKLITEVENRLGALTAIKQDTKKLNDARDSVKAIIRELETPINNCLKSKHISLDENKHIKDLFTCLLDYLGAYSLELEIDIIFGKIIKDQNKLILNENDVKKIIELCESKIRTLEAQMQGAPILEIQSKMILSYQAYITKKKLKSEKQSLEGQADALENIITEFMKKQKMELDTFIKDFSDQINEYYQFMHPGEKIEKIELITTEENEELNGIVVSMSYFGKVKAPPQKYLSESHLNSLGIALFLAAVRAFNKRNQFIILDDIVSSFDSNHRVRLARLLLEKFADYQVVLLTHEKEWFEFVKRQVKGIPKWKVKAIKWNEERGTHIDETLVELRNEIEKKITDGDANGLGNSMRTYLEKFLKRLAEDIEVRVRYRSNDSNEDRMPGELISELERELNKQPSKTSFETIIKKIKGSNYIGTKGSHDSGFNPGIGDCIAFWEDIKNFENLFVCSCQSCKESITTKYFDNVNKKIRCRCGTLSYDWKE